MKLNWMVVVLSGIVVFPLALLVYFGKTSSEVLIGIVVTLGAWLSPSPVQRPTTETHTNSNVIERADHVLIKSEPPPPVEQP